MKLPTITNAVLTEVRAASLKADYDRSEVLGDPKWTGSERVNSIHVKEEQTRASRGDLGLPMVDILVEQTVVVDSRLAHANGFHFDEGDVLSYQRDGEDPETGTVQWLRTTDGLGLGGVTRLILDRA